MILCEKPLGAHRRRSARRWSTRSRRPACRTRVWYNYRRVPAVTLAKQLIDEGKFGRDLPLPRQVPAGLDDLARPAAGRRGPVAARRRGRRQRRHRRSARPLHRHGALAQRPDHRGHGDDRDVHQGAQAQPHRQGREGRHRRRLRWSCAGSRTARWRCSRRPATPAATRRSTRSRSTARTPQPSGTCTTCTACSTSTTATRASVRGWRSVHVTDGDQPYMKHWWVPGLQIGYEHTFIHQVADFVEAAAERQGAAADVPGRARHRLRHRRDPRSRRRRGSGRRSGSKSTSTGSRHV